MHVSLLHIESCFGEFRAIGFTHCGTHVAMCINKLRGNIFRKKFTSHVLLSISKATTNFVSSVTVSLDLNMTSFLKTEVVPVEASPSTDDSSLSSEISDRFFVYLLSFSHVQMPNFLTLSIPIK